MGSFPGIGGELWPGEMGEGEAGLPACLFWVCPEESQVRLAVYEAQTSGLGAWQACSEFFSVQPWEPGAGLLEARSLSSGLLGYKHCLL